VLNTLYKSSLALLTDLYQLSMAYGYWKNGRDRQEACFHVTFRAHPFGGGFSIACGLQYVIDYLQGLRFEASDLEYLSHITGNDGRPLFDRAFLDYLASLKFELDIDAMPEGTAVFPQEPLLRVVGPILQAQIVETPILNMLNFQTLIATKAARVVLATRGEPVLEFGLRRAQGIDGALASARAAYVGGAEATSNVLAGKLFGIPVKGTHAHSWVMSFDDELESFRAFARAMPNNCIFLVDTYDSLEGVRRATVVGQELKKLGHQMAGIRLDSGDLAYLSIEARKILDEAGLHDAKIVASNDLDEHIIDSLKDQGAKIAIWGVGTKLATAFDQPAIGGVYKLSAIRDTPGSPWRHRIKLSESTAKVSVPGILQARRFSHDGQFIGDAIYDTLLPQPAQFTIVDPADPIRRKMLPEEAQQEDLLVPIFRRGKRVYDPPPLAASRQRTIDQLDRFHPAIKRFVNPHIYPVGLEKGLHELRQRLIEEAKAQ
jgi:nicotinate phosphoribosyltransferase